MSSVLCCVVDCTARLYCQVPCRQGLRPRWAVPHPGAPGAARHPEAGGAPVTGCFTAGLVIFQARAVAGWAQRCAAASVPSAVSVHQKPLPCALAAPGGMDSRLICAPRPPLTPAPHCLWPGALSKPEGSQGLTELGLFVPHYRIQFLESAPLQTEQIDV